MVGFIVLLAGCVFIVPITCVFKQSCDTMSVYRYEFIIFEKTVGPIIVEAQTARHTQIYCLIKAPRVLVPK